MLVSCYLKGNNRADNLLSLLYAFRAQTFRDWEVVVVHDGPGDEELDAVKRLLPPDERFRFYSTPTWAGRWGHPNREWGLSLTTGSLIGLANDDGWYAPVYLEQMVRIFNAGADYVYCNMLHNARAYQVLDSNLKINEIDMGNWMSRRAFVLAAPWRDFSYTGDGVFAIDVATAVYGAGGHIEKLTDVLFAHN